MVQRDDLKRLLAKLDDEDERQWEEGLDLLSVALASGGDGLVEDLLFLKDSIHPSARTAVLIEIARVGGTASVRAVASLLADALAECAVPGETAFRSLERSLDGGDIVSLVQVVYGKWRDQELGQLTRLYAVAMPRERIAVLELITTMTHTGAPISRGQLVAAQAAIAADESDPSVSQAREAIEYRLKHRTSTQ